MKFACVDVDEQGHSFFRETDLPQTGTLRRISSKNQNVKYWKMSVSQPGHSVDFTTAPALMFVAIFSGQMNLTVSNGETRQFVRGDMLTLFDIRGQGHMLKFVGDEPCHVLYIAVADKGEFT
jgi:quercetin dioxygenase-like cupin family protein